jgi:uncharacterized protein YjdB
MLFYRCGSKRIFPRFGKVRFLGKLPGIQTIISAISVSLDETAITLDYNEAKLLFATVSPEGTTDKSVTWSSSDESVATVSDKGLVRAVNTGSAVITVKTNDGGHTATCTVAVNKIAVTGVKLDKKSSLTLTEGETATLTATVSPSNATDKSVAWSSTIPECVSVKDGVITALKRGNALISATTADGGYIASCSVTVEPAAGSVTGVTLNTTVIEVNVGETETLTATVSPDDATNKKVTWSSSDESIATVDANGVVTGKKNGAATITVTTEDFGYKASCTVSVKVVGSVTGIKLTVDGTEPVANELWFNTEGQSMTIVATVEPSELQKSCKFTWTPSNGSWESYTIKDNGDGTCTVTLNTMVYGSFTLTCTTDLGGSASIFVWDMN